MRVNFLVKKNKFHYWLQAPDGANVTPKFIVCQNLLVEHLGWKYKVAEEEKLIVYSKGFPKKILLICMYVAKVTVIKAIWIYVLLP